MILSNADKIYCSKGNLHFTIVNYDIRNSQAHLKAVILY